MSMKKGEIAYVTIPPEHAFNRVESKQDLAVVPPNSTVHYEIELVSFVKVGWCSLASLTFYSFLLDLSSKTNRPSLVYLQEKESWDLNTAEKIEAAGKKKEEGNALFKLGKHVRASKRYEKVNHLLALNCYVKCRNNY